jgi:hypothetical protein
MNKNLLTLLILFIFLFLLAIGVYKYSQENYFQEYNGIIPNYKFYRPFPMDQSEDILQKDRCKSCKGYNNIQYEPYCPHNCRQYGVSLCDQGRIL